MLLILASASPRRQELIQLLGVPWEMMVADVDESSVHHPDPAVDVVDTAGLKAVTIAQKAPADAVIVAADTTVVLDGQRLNKPDDEGEARQMLRRLRGRTHQVYTGIVAINNATGKTVTDVARIDVPMRDYSDGEIDTYVASGDPLDKAGAYAIQHEEFRPVIDLSGCYAGVIGLPLCHLTRTLYQVGIKVEIDIAGACQAYHNYDCPVFENILKTIAP